MTHLSHADLDKQTVTKAYARWAPVYDLVFGAVFERGRHAAIAAAERVGGRILEVGVGTGISLPHYSKRLPALRRRYFRTDAAQGAASASTELGLTNVEGLWVMDAEHLAFPGRLVRRRRGAIRHHHGAESRKRRSTSSRACSSRAARSCWSAASAPKPDCGGALEHWFAPAARKLGWRTEFSFERYARWAAATARHALDRAPRHAAVRAFLAHPLRQGRRRSSARRTSRRAPRADAPPADATRVIARCAQRAARVFRLHSCCHTGFIKSP